MGDWDVRTDEEKNRLYLHLDGHFTETEAEASTDATIEAARELDPGFDVVTDLSNFQPGDPAAMKHVERGKRVVAEEGVAAAVRVMADSTTGQMQWDRAGEGEESYQVAMAESVERAEKLLDERRERRE